LFGAWGEEELLRLLVERLAIRLRDIELGFLLGKRSEDRIAVQVVRHDEVIDLGLNFIDKLCLSCQNLLGRCFENLTDGFRVDRCEDLGKDVSILHNTRLVVFYDLKEL
jgi:hypothetical protein